MSGSGISWAICKSAHRSRQITTPAPHYSVFLQAGCPFCRPTNSVKALKALYRHSVDTITCAFYLAIRRDLHCYEFILFYSVVVCIVPKLPTIVKESESYNRRRTTKSKKNNHRPCWEAIRPTLAQLWKAWTRPIPTAPVYLRYDTKRNAILTCAR